MIAFRSMSFAGYGLALLMAAWSPRVRAQEPKPSAPAPDSLAPAESAPKPSPPLQLAAAVEPVLQELLLKQRDGMGRGCERKQVAAQADLRYVACGAAGVWVLRELRGEYTLISSQDVGGSAQAFFVLNDRLWVEVSSARALDLGVSVRGGAQPEPERPQLPAPVLPSAQPTAAEAPAPARLGPSDAEIQVVEADEDSVVVNFGPAVSLTTSSRLAFYPAADTLAADSGELSPDRPLVIGRVTNVAGARARVALGVNEPVPVGARARLTNAAATESSFAPPRAAGHWHLGFMARPFLVLDDLGVGAFFDARAGYRFRVPLHLEAVIAPFAFGTARAGATVPFGAFVSASFDTRVFEVGLGVGGQTVNAPGFALDRGTGTLISQRLRLGAVDGAHLEVFSYVVLFHSEFEFSNLRVQAQIPLGSRIWLIAAGGAGLLGLGYGELGLRSLMSGNGGPGSFFLSASIGGVTVFEDCNQLDTDCTGLDYFGPMLGFGGEWRL